jgi:polyisoprenoid-binding protein YceI
MRFMLALFAVASLLLVVDSQNAAGQEKTAAGKSGRAIALTPENTRIQFVGTHVGPKPDPRTGGFEKFKGTMELEPATGVLKSVAVEIDTQSLWTEIPKLTNHLKSADFFEVRQFPIAAFKSTAIKPAAGGKFEITGNLTLHGVTKEIKFPATLKSGPNGPVLRSEFKIDRTAFDMNFGPDRVEKEVAMTVTVGEKVEPGKGKRAGDPGRG